MKLKIVLLTIFILILTNVVFALQPKVSIVNNNSISINNQIVAVFRVPIDNISPADRANLFVLKLMELSGNDLTADSVTVSKKTLLNSTVSILIRDVEIIQITDEEARLLNSTPEGIANVWANNIKNALLIKPVSISETSGTVPLYETRSKPLEGNALSKLTITVDNPNIATATFNNSTNCLEIKGNAVGTAVITITAEDTSVIYTAYVKKYAANLPCSLSATVTGNPTPSSLVSEVMRKTLLRKIKTEPNVNININSIKWDVKNLSPTQITSAIANVTCNGNDYISVTKDITISVENKYIKHGEPDTLLYSNNPETIEKFGDLFTGQLDINQESRLLYHHLNSTGQNATLLIEVINPNDEDVDLKVTKAAAKPIIDTIAIGLVAVKDFMNQDDKNVSIFETIPGKSRACYLADNLNNKYSSSGIMQFKQLNGNKECIVRVRLVKPEEADNTLEKSKPYLGTGEFNFSDFKFLNPVKEFNEKYEVGKDWVFVSIGKLHLENEKHMKLYGNYGVTYNINVDIENPTEKTTKVKVILDPTAGSMAAYLRVNDEYKTIHHIKPPNEGILATYTLKPGEKKSVNIKTIPVSGSNYPAKIVVGTL